MPITHAKTNAVSDWTQAELDAAIAAGQFAPGTTLADIVLPSDWNDEHTLSLTTAEVTASTNKNYVTDAQLTVIGNTSGTNSGDQTISDATISTTDITTNNASTTKHGFLKKLSNVSTEFMNGQGNWATPAGGGTPGGSTTQVQYNSSGAFAGSSNLTWANGSQTLSVGNTGTLDGGNQLNFASNAKALRLDTNGIYPTTGDGGLNLGYIGGGFSFGSLTLTGSIRAGSVSKTSNYTATTSDSTITVDASGGAVTITGYACASHAGRILIIKKTDSSGNAVTFDPNASETVDGASTKATSTQYGGFIVQVNAAATAWNVIGTF